MFSELLMYLMNFSDRWFILFYESSKELGFYSVGSKMAMLLGVAVVIFRLSWAPLGLSSIHSEDGSKLIKIIFNLYLAIGNFAIIYLVFLTPFILNGL